MLYVGHKKLESIAGVWVVLLKSGNQLRHSALHGERKGMRRVIIRKTITVTDLMV